MSLSVSPFLNLHRSPPSGKHLRHFIPLMFKCAWRQPWCRWWWSASLSSSPSTRLPFLILMSAWLFTWKVLLWRVSLHQHCHSALWCWRPHASARWSSRSWSCLAHPWSVIPTEKVLFAAFDRCRPEMCKQPFCGSKACSESCCWWCPQCCKNTAWNHCRIETQLSILWGTSVIASLQSIALHRRDEATPSTKVPHKSSNYGLAKVQRRLSASHYW